MYNANYFTEKYLYNTYLCENQPKNFYEMHKSRQKVKGKRAYLNPFVVRAAFSHFVCHGTCIMLLLNVCGFFLPLPYLTSIVLNKLNHEKKHTAGSVNPSFLCPNR